jgi:hypothetical protein
MADRAVSTTLSYVLTLTITAMLASGLLIAAGSVVEDRQETVVRDELEVAGNQLASRLMAADRLVETGAEVVTVQVPLPDSVAGSGYTVAVEPASDRIVLEATGVETSVSVSYATHTGVAAASLSGGDLEIALDGGQLEVRSA